MPSLYIRFFTKTKFEIIETILQNGQLLVLKYDCVPSMILPYKINNIFMDHQFDRYVDIEFSTNDGESKIGLHVDNNTFKFDDGIVKPVIRNIETSAPPPKKKGCGCGK